MRENHDTQSSEYIIICQDGLFIVSTTPDEILHMLKDKYKINIYLQEKYPHDPGGRDICHWIAPRIMHYISFALHFSCITFQLHLKIMPHQHEMHDTS